MELHLFTCDRCGQEYESVTVDTFYEIFRWKLDDGDVVCQKCAIKAEKVSIPRPRLHSVGEISR